MKFVQTEIADVVCINHAPFIDERGEFCRIFCSEELSTLTCGRLPNQLNLSRTALKGSFRGFHVQHAPAAEYKIVQCIKGMVRDYALDLRAGSPTLLKIVEVELAENTRKALFMPPGIAHGFQSLADDVVLLYIHSGHYAPEFQTGVRYDDPLIRLQLPLQVSVISERDRNHPLLDETFRGIEI